MQELLLFLVLGPVLDDLGRGTGHLAAELAVPLALAELLDPISQIRPEFAAETKIVKANGIVLLDIISVHPSPPTNRSGFLR